MKKEKCKTGCKIFTGGEIHHHKDCVFYPDSMSRIYDKMEQLLKDIYECPYDIDPVTISKAGIDAHPEHVCGNMSMNYTKHKRLKKILRK